MLYIVVNADLQKGSGNFINTIIVVHKHSFADDSS